MSVETQQYINPTKLRVLLTVVFLSFLSQNGVKLTKRKYMQVCSLDQVIIVIIVCYVLVVYHNLKDVK